MRLDWLFGCDEVAEGLGDVRLDDSRADFVVLPSRSEILGGDLLTGDWLMGSVPSSDCPDFAVIIGEWFDPVFLEDDFLDGSLAGICFSDDFLADVVLSTCWMGCFVFLAC